MYYGARYYDPELGRFIQPDPIVAYPDDPQCFNRYTYARNNPVIYTDPTGNFWWFFAAIIGAIVGAITGAVSAAVQGGNIALGAVFGAVVGAITGVAAIGFKEAMMGAFAGKIISPVVGGMITGTEFAIGGFGAGLTTGYAGGEGSIGDMFSQAGIGAAIGFGVGFAAGYSYTAGWQGVLHGADTVKHNINVLKQQCAAALKSGDLVTYGKVAGELQKMGVDVPKLSTIAKKEWWEPFKLFIPGYEEYGGPMREGSGIPQNSLDNIFQLHDKDWIQVGRKEANLRVVDRLFQLPDNPNRWSEPPKNSIYGYFYKKGAEVCFWWDNYFRGK